MPPPHHVTPHSPGGVCAPTRYVCTEPGEQVLTSPAALAATHTPAWQQLLPPGSAGETPSPLEMLSAAPWWPHRRAQTPPSPSEPASQEHSAKWWEVPFGTGSSGQNLWTSRAFHRSILDVGNPRGSLG